MTYNVFGGTLSLTQSIILRTTQTYTIAYEHCTCCRLLDLSAVTSMQLNADHNIAVYIGRMVNGSAQCRVSVVFVVLEAGLRAPRSHQVS